MFKRRPLIHNPALPEKKSVPLYIRCNIKPGEGQVRRYVAWRRWQQALDSGGARVRLMGAENKYVAAFWQSHDSKSERLLLGEGKVAVMSWVNLIDLWHLDAVTEEAPCIFNVLLVHSSGSAEDHCISIILRCPYSSGIGHVTACPVHSEGYDVMEDACVVSLSEMSIAKISVAK